MSDVVDRGNERMVRSYAYGHHGKDRFVAPNLEETEVIPNDLDDSSSNTYAGAQQQLHLPSTAAGGISDTITNTGPSWKRRAAQCVESVLQKVTTVGSADDSSNQRPPTIVKVGGIDIDVGWIMGGQASARKILCSKSSK